MNEIRLNRATAGAINKWVSENEYIEEGPIVEVVNTYELLNYLASLISEENNEITTEDVFAFGQDLYAKKQRQFEGFMRYVYIINFSTGELVVYSPFGKESDKILATLQKETSWISKESEE